MIDPNNIPEGARDSIDRYVNDRIPPGGFIQAVICNDLTAAVGRADHINIRALPEIVAYLYWYVPANAWGSAERMKAWLETDNEKH